MRPWPWSFPLDVHKIKKLHVCEHEHCARYLIGLECCFDHEPALCALSVLHLEDVMAQVFTCHFYKALFSLQNKPKVQNKAKKKNNNSRNKFSRDQRLRFALWQMFKVHSVTWL